MRVLLIAMLLLAGCGLSASDQPQSPAQPGKPGSSFREPAAHAGTEKPAEKDNLQVKVIAIVNGKLAAGFTIGGPKDCTHIYFLLQNKSDSKIVRADLSRFLQAKVEDNFGNSYQLLAGVGDQTTPIRPDEFLIVAPAFEQVLAKAKKLTIAMSSPTTEELKNLNFSLELKEGKKTTIYASDDAQEWLNKLAKKLGKSSSQYELPKD